MKYKIALQDTEEGFSESVSRVTTIPRHNPVNAFTMGGIVQDAGIAIDDFRKLL